MKLVLLILLIFSSNYLGAQKVDSTENIVFISRLEIQPKWTEGTNQELIQEIISRVKLPKKKGIKGTTFLQFEVDTTGQVINPLIRRSISKKIDKQLLDLICNYTFEPGVLIDKKVNCILYLPIQINLE